MRYGFLVPEGGTRAVVELAREAQQAPGWDGVYYYNAICVGEMGTYDPWIVVPSPGGCI
jgi:hypothetical protein